ncbi:hypothetical protein EUA47_03010 [Staphylococcus saprophyticus]|uniref:Uncharacterized protein n=1 Tax=uncultured Caudovirales phage TaxID=2100421 RepID=A0A2H4JB57_9CAUD|nr:hypothetical protein [Staphylococcus saprophyticus]ASN70557.1 hypothetical protein 10S1_54 [uncultured Caudovirales phage]RXS23215.1 hypothetical protein EUA47_03010 [Staphylococcus saprophyticus]
MAYEYEGKLLDYASGSKTYEEYKAMTQELQEIYHKAEILNKIVNIIKTGRSLNSNIDFEIIVLAIEHELIYLEDK